MIALAAIGYALLPPGGGPARAGAWAPYEWPIKPFDRPHPIRGDLDDPRGGGFHSGVDISASGGTPVYSVAAGRVCTLSGAYRSHPTDVGVCGKGFEFAYWHLRPVVESGERLSEHQLIGYVLARWGHVHLTEMWGKKTWNPLRKGALTPYEDRTKPTIVSVRLFRQGGYLALPAAPLSGRVDLVVDAYDTPELKSNWPSVVTPVLIRWYLLSEPDGKTVISTRTAVDFRLNKLKVPLDDVYAPGTRKNGPRRTAVYDFWLVRGLDTTKLPNGAYRLVVLASDTRENIARRSFELSVSNTIG